MELRNDRQSGWLAGPDRTPNRNSASGEAGCAQAQNLQLAEATSANDGMASVKQKEGEGMGKKRVVVERRTVCYIDGEQIGRAHV